MKVAWHECYAHPLPENHRFPMEKYNLIKDQLLYEGTLDENDFIRPNAMEEKDILLTHDGSYLEKIKLGTLDKRAQRKTGFPWSKELFLREVTIMQGTWDCCHYAYQNGVALNIAGGTHHAYSNSGEGFCLLNDFAISANLLLERAMAKKVLILDLDVHQGNGTAKIFEGRDDVFTFSVHGEKNYPLPKEKSDWDIGLDDNVKDQDYLNTLQMALDKLFSNHSFDFVLYQSGVDILACDKLGRLSVSLQACKQRDQMVFERIQEQGIPIVCAMGGGYSPSIRKIVEAHSNTFRLAKSILA